MPFGSPPAWSPDSRSIAYVDQRQDLCILALTGGTRCLNVQPAGQPTWSPDGAAVAYLCRVCAAAACCVSRSTAGRSRRCSPASTG
ncbi:MAG: hypothetical protein HND48_21990 [Chloroflexi bacterium]|nr:hypothetical protein [Chloroflexota bacterium]